MAWGKVTAAKYIPCYWPNTNQHTHAISTYTQTHCSGTCHGDIKVGSVFVKFSAFDSQLHFLLDPYCNLVNLSRPHYFFFLCNMGIIIVCTLGSSLNNMMHVTCLTYRVQSVVIISYWFYFCFNFFKLP